MTDKPAESAVERYEEYADVPDSHYLPPLTLKHLADDAIAALEAELERVKSDLRFITNYTTSERERKALKRAEAAEKLVYDLSIERDDFLLRAQNAEAERDRLKWMLIRNVCDECLVHTSGACSEEEGEDCPPVRDALADLAARYDARHEDGDG